MAGRHVWRLRRTAVALWALLALAALGVSPVVGTVPGDVALSFMVPTLDGANFSFNAEQPFNFATLFLTAEASDPFTHYMWADPDSLAMFLVQAPPDTHYVFLPSLDTPLTAMMAHWSQALADAPISEARRARWQQQVQWATAPPATVPVLATALSAFSSPRTTLSVGTDLTISRLDCLYAWCSWPVDGQQVNLSYNADPCNTSALANWTSRGMLVLLDDLLSCSLDALLISSGQANVAALVVGEASNSSYIRAIGAQVAAQASPGDMMVTSVAYADAQRLQALLASAGASGILNATFNTSQEAGLMVGLDAQGRWIELGWEKYPYLMMLGWQAQYQLYLQDLAANLSKPSFIVPIMDRQTMHQTPGAVATLTMPDYRVLQATYDTLELDMALSCPGSTDADCPVWDHTVQLFVCCSINGTNTSTCGAELGRWISPFRRRIGRWLTPITELWPLLAAERCTFTMQTVAWALPWVVSANLRFSSTTIGPPTSSWPTTAIALFQGGTFNQSYNDRSSLTVSIPGNYRRVFLEAVITGHGSDENGCGEFCPTSHHFIINGDEHYVNFSAAGTPFGCADQARYGAEPNETHVRVPCRIQPTPDPARQHGTWYYGRDGWCDGQNVRPWVVDVTDSIAKNASSNVTVQYYGWYHGHTPNPQQSPGQILMESHLIVYATPSAPAPDM